MRASEEAVRLLEHALSIASAGADEAEVSLGGHVLGVTRFAENAVNQAIEVDQEVLAVRVALGGRIGRAETCDYSTAGMQNVARQAKMLAELLPKNNGGAQLGFPKRQTHEGTEAFDPETERATALDRMAIIGRTVIHAHRENLVSSGYLATSFGAVDPCDEGGGIYAIANTHGLVAYHAATRATFSVTMAGPAGRSGWAEGQSFALGNLDADAIAELASKKATAPGELRVLAPGRYTAVLEPCALAGLLAFIGQTCGSAEVEAGASFLSGRIGSKITGESITIADDYAHELHRGAPFDAEGVTRKRVPIIENGIAGGPVYSHANAARAGVEPTGHKVIGPHGVEREAAMHLVMNGGGSTLPDLVEGVKSGVLISRVWNTRLIDPLTLTVTGVTRDGTFLLENGRVAGPVANMRFNVSVLDLLASIDAMTPAVWATGGVVPAVRVRELPLVTGVAA